MGYGDYISDGPTKFNELENNPWLSDRVESNVNNDGPNPWLDGRVEIPTEALENNPWLDGGIDTNPWGDMSSLHREAGNYELSPFDTTPSQIDDTQSNAPRVMDIVSELRGDTSRDGTGSLNFDPSRAASRLTDAEKAVGYTPEDESRVFGSLADSAMGTLKGNAAKMGLMNQLGGQVNPGDLLNPQGLVTAIPRAMMSAAGVEAPDNLFGSMVSKLPAGLAALAGVNPVAGVAAGLVGGPLADALGDYFGMREADDARDLLEDASGQLRGRRQYRNIMDRFDVDDVRYAEEEGDFGLASDRAANQLQMAQNKPATNVDLIQDQMNKFNAYEMAQGLIDYQKEQEAIEAARQAEAARDAQMDAKYTSSRWTGGNGNGNGGYSSSNQGMAGGGAQDDDGGAGWGF